MKLLVWLFWWNLSNLNQGASTAGNAPLKGYAIVPESLKFDSDVYGAASIKIPDDLTSYRSYSILTLKDFKFTKMI